MSSSRLVHLSDGTATIDGMLDIPEGAVGLVLFPTVAVRRACFKK